MELFLASYIIAFALVHSYTASAGFKKWAWGYVEPSTYRLIYAAVSAVTVLPLAGIWLLQRGNSPVVYLIPYPYRWISFLVMLLGAAIAVLSLVQTDVLEFMGIRSALGGTSKEAGLVTSGIYRFVRHPLYLGGMLVFWANSEMRLMDLAATAMITAYFVVGSRLEERKLLAEFGGEYSAYMESVSAFLPLKWVKHRLG